MREAFGRRGGVRVYRTPQTVEQSIWNSVLVNAREGVFRSPDARFTRVIFLSVPPLQGSDLSLNPTQGFTLGYSLSPFQGSGGCAAGPQAKACGSDGASENIQSRGL